MGKLPRAEDITGMRAGQTKINVRTEAEKYRLTPLQVITVYGSIETALCRAGSMDPLAAHDIALFVRDIAADAAKKANGDDTEYAELEAATSLIRARDPRWAQYFLALSIERREQAFPCRNPEKYVYHALRHRRYSAIKITMITQFFGRLQEAPSPGLFNTQLTRGMCFPLNVRLAEDGIHLSFWQPEGEAPAQEHGMHITPYEVMLLSGGEEAFDAFAAELTRHCLTGRKAQDIRVLSALCDIAESVTQTSADAKRWIRQGNDMALYDYRQKGEELSATKAEAVRVS
jgi:hypothetical protein